MRGCPFRKVERSSKLSSNARLEVASENTNAQACCAYDIFLQQFKSLMALSHPYSCSYHLFFQGISLPDPSLHPFLSALRRIRLYRRLERRSALLNRGQRRHRGCVGGHLGRIFQYRYPHLPLQLGLG